MVLKLSNLLFAAAFVLSALVQYNDPDPLLWIVMYSAAAICCLAFHWQKLRFAVGSVVAAIALVWALSLLPTVVRHPPPLSEVFGDVKMYAPGVEEAREMGGLLIVALWLGVLSARVRTQRKRATSERV